MSIIKWVFKFIWLISYSKFLIIVIIYYQLKCIYIAALFVIQIHMFYTYISF